jgi:hypothetical protein
MTVALRPLNVWKKQRQAINKGKVFDLTLRRFYWSPNQTIKINYHYHYVIQNNITQ